MPLTSEIFPLDGIAQVAAVAQARLSTDLKAAPNDLAIATNDHSPLKRTNTMSANRGRGGHQLAANNILAALPGETVGRKQEAEDAVALDHIDGHISQSHSFGHSQSSYLSSSDSDSPSGYSDSTGLDSILEDIPGIGRGEGGKLNEMPMFNIKKGQYAGANALVEDDSRRQITRTCGLYSRRRKCYVIHFDRGLY